MQLFDLFGGSYHCRVVRFFQTRVPHLQALICPYTEEGSYYVVRLSKQA